ncbi:hypothetical protein [Paenibacillus alvei]|uniref:hypothetical protein n=1 Tax=Paenibacillus alvei TaxID=44250 RepID=UPI0022807B88|nr:hypothetical protein [Paenibacillus alvei]
MKSYSVINPLIHVVLTFIFGYLTVSFESMLILLIGNFFIIVLNALTYTYSMKTDTWKDFFLSIAIFIVTVVIIVFLLVATGDPSKEVDENYGVGLIVVIVFILSFPTLIIGNLIGIIIKKRSRKNI